jgi:intracellular septation protein A
MGDPRATCRGDGLLIGQSEADAPRVTTIAEDLRPRPMLVAGCPDDRATRPPTAKRPILVAVARRGVPRVIEATVIPTTLFFVLALTVNTAAAMVAVLGWTYCAVLRRAMRRRPVPPLVALAAVALTVRTAVGLLSGSTFAYFIQPVASTVVLGVVFLGSVLIGRPVIARLANEFCPLDDEVHARPAVIRLFAGLTLLWAAVHLLTSAVTFTMLVTMPVPLFVALKTVTCLTITVLAIVLTVSWSMRVAKRENLVFAPTI